MHRCHHDISANNNDLLADQPHSIGTPITRCARIANDLTGDLI